MDSLQPSVEPDPAFAAATLSNCDREPIHIPGSVQPHGALLALDPDDLHVVHAGGDTRGLLGVAFDALPGQPIDPLLSPAEVARLRSVLRDDNALFRAVRAFGRTGIGGMPPADAVAYRSGDLLVLEFEPRYEVWSDDRLDWVRSMTHNVQNALAIPEFCDALAAEVRAASGFDRVMVYRFLPDASGAVIAEARSPHVESFLGLHYPESDIPKQARALYAKNWLRIIPDAGYAPAPIVPTVAAETGQPLDLSLSAIRSVSPLHLQYLANMGVAASMSLSLVCGGRLWGLVACHHATPRFLSRRRRNAFELFAMIVSSQLDIRLTSEDLQARLHSSKALQNLVATMSREADFVEGLIRFRSELLDFIPASGVVLWFDGAWTTYGATPTQEQVGALVAWLNAQPRQEMFHSDCLPLVYPPAEAFADLASGILALPASHGLSDYVLWFRPEVVRTVTWAGNPNKPSGPDADAGVLTPRRSFAAWRQSVRLHSAPWTTPELEAARQLRVVLLEVVLQRINQVASEREIAQRRQNALMQELDQRLREWRAVAAELQRETERRAVAESELSEVLRRTVTDQEAERLRIAREMHDTLGQSLTLLKLGLDGIGHTPGLPDSLHERLESLKALATDAGREINRLAWEIRPTALDDLGLQSAVRSLLETWSQQTSILFELHLAVDGPRLAPAVETTLYRVLQEALTNVVRHAEASRVAVILTLAAGHVTMIVEDDGRGMPEGQVGAAGATGRRLGLLGIRERVSTVGGAVELESAAGKGTTLFVKVPV